MQMSCAEASAALQEKKLLPGLDILPGNPDGGKENRDNQISKASSPEVCEEQLTLMLIFDPIVPRFLG